MSHNNHLMKHVYHALGHQAAKERANGNSGGANGIVLIAFGICLLPIPFIGIPLLIWGITQLCRNPPKEGGH